ncbi:MAG: hypothetical protein GY853_15410 [PVC group bacterium]|nr:hypothetical protein [PVC group bacterium]
MEGVDFYLQNHPKSRVFAFQFKAPLKHTINSPDTTPYKFKIKQQQHSKLFGLANGQSGCVFYVLPFYEEDQKLYQNCPNLLKDTWFLSVHNMNPMKVFGGRQSRTLKCKPNIAVINPKFEMFKLDKKEPTDVNEGLSAKAIREWIQRMIGEQNHSNFRLRGNGLLDFLIVKDTGQNTIINPDVFTPSST